MNLTDMTWPAVEALERTTPIVFPIAAMEQHGRHMPLFTDSLLLGEVCRRVQHDPVAEKVLFAPLQWLGNSHHHLDFPGTISATPRVYLDLLRDQAECFLAHGFTRFIYLNGHGGNIVPSQQAAFELKQKYRDRKDVLFTALTYWDAADPSASLTGLSQRQMGHACEWETSMIQVIAPQLIVGDPAAVAEVPFGRGFAPGHRSWVMPDRSAEGHIGNPAKASAAKGEALLELFATGVVSYLKRVLAWDGQGWDA